MKKFIVLMCSVLLSVFGFSSMGFAAEKVSGVVTGCKSAYLMDSNSGECIYSENERARMPIASVCKVMTLTLCFEAAERGDISFDDSVVASDNAAGMGGSQVFLKSGNSYSIDQLIKSVVVCSANDSCVALSETVCGSEDAFVAKMNKRAAELGCTDTLFANCTGLPKETQYSCARDVALMFANLIKHDRYFSYSKIWLEDFVHPDDRTTSMTNTNKLIRKYSACDGGKTGFTNEAGFCLAATAMKDNMRLVSVVLGADSSDNRFSSTVRMFDYGFGNFKNKIVLDSEIRLNDDFSVRGGKKSTFAVTPERNSYVFSPVDSSPDVSYKIIAFDVKAPVSKGQQVGVIEVYKDNVLYDTVNAVAAEDVKKASYGDYFKIASENWAI